MLRRYAEARYSAKSWKRKRRVVARIEASTQGLDIRFVVTNLIRGSAEWPLAAGQPGAPAAARRGLLADVVGPGCHSETARAGLAEFTTLRQRLLKIAARITETATRVRMALAAACPQAVLFGGIARSLQLAGP